MDQITWSHFEKVEIRVGSIVDVQPFPEARKPAYKMTVDFGDDIGIRRSSARITEVYDPADLVGKQVMAVVNFPAKQIGPFMSECLVTGFPDDQGRIVLAVPDGAVPNGARLM